MHDKAPIEGSKEYPSQTINCPACMQPTMEPFFRMPGVPVFCNSLKSTRAEALAAPRADITLAVCSTCGLIHNIEYNPLLTKYNQSYENSLHFSPRFRRYAENLARQLTLQHQLAGKSVIEIGCGQGDFLVLFASNGVSQCFGFDPSYDAANPPELFGSTVRIYQDFYSEAYMNQPVDLVCCRHVLEHIARPYEFLLSIRRALHHRTSTVVFFEVPNAAFTLGTAVWDIIYEHCSYFTEQSLSSLFVRAGFEPFEVGSRFGGQFLAIQARPLTATAAVGLPATGTRVNVDFHRDFALRYATRVRHWKSKLRRLKQQGKSAAIWGAGSKGVQFLNGINLSFREIQYAVDINPRKHDRYIPGTGQLIVPPEFLRSHHVDTVIVMNPIYENEIRQVLNELNVESELLLVEPAEVKSVSNELLSYR